MKKQDKEIFIEVFENKGGNINASCKAFGISRQTFYNWKNDDDEFASKIRDVQEGLIDFVESKLMENIKDNDTTSTIFYLKTKGKSRGYTERQEIEHQGKNVNIEIELTDPKK